MRGQGVHGLGTGDARHEFHGERVDAGLGQAFRHLGVAVRAEMGDQQDALQLGQSRVIRAAHREERVGALECCSCGADFRTCVGKGVIGHGGGQARALLDGDFMAGGHEFLDGFRGGCHAGFTRMSFFQNGNSHFVPPLLA